MFDYRLSLRKQKAPTSKFCPENSHLFYVASCSVNWNSGPQQTVELKNSVAVLKTNLKPIQPRTNKTLQCLILGHLRTVKPTYSPIQHSPSP
jgi:hypothetical protein